MSLAPKVVVQLEAYKMLAMPQSITTFCAPTVMTTNLPTRRPLIRMLGPIGQQLSGE